MQKCKRAAGGHRRQSTALLAALCVTEDALALLVFVLRVRLGEVRRGARRVDVWTYYWECTADDMAAESDVGDSTDSEVL